MFKKIMVLSLLCTSTLCYLSAENAPDNCPPQIGRYQISSYGQGGGVYLVDTSTGQVWKAKAKGWGEACAWVPMVDPLEQTR